MLYETNRFPPEAAAVGDAGAGIDSAGGHLGPLGSYADRGVPALTPREHQRLAESLRLAAARLRPPPMLQLYPEMTAADGFGIGRSLVRGRIVAGERLVGVKAVPLEDGTIGAAWLTDTMFRGHAAPIAELAASASLRPALAFVLGSSVAATAELDEQAFAAAVTAVMPCVEVLTDRGFGVTTTAARVIAEAAVEVIVFGGASRAMTHAEVCALQVTGPGGGAEPRAGHVAFDRGRAVTNDLIGAGLALPSGFAVVAPCGGARPAGFELAFGPLGAIRVRSTPV